MSTLRTRAAFAVVAVSVAGAIVLGGCTQTTDADKAKAEVDRRTAAVTEAQTAYDDARTSFCRDARTYVAALDKYGKLFSDEAATVGDVRSLGAELDLPHGRVQSSAQDTLDAHQELTDAKAKLADAQAEAAGSTTAAPSSTTSTTLLPAATVDRIAAEQQDLEAAINGVSDDTPLAQAGQQVNAAAFALEVAWLRVLSDAGCLTSEEASQSQVALTSYTAAVQAALRTLGLYAGEIDGIYGSATVAAVRAFQTSKGLPATGYIDEATATALETALVAKGGEAAVQAVATAAAVQSTLKLAGYWTGPVDGHWTQALTDALKSFQQSLGVPATGAVDTATMDALRRAITTPPSTTTTAPAPTSTTARPSTSVTSTSTPSR